MAKVVAAPIEEQLSGVEKMLYFRSRSSSNGTVSITVTFEVGTDVDKAVFNVNNRVQLATPRLHQHEIEYASPNHSHRDGQCHMMQMHGFMCLL